MTEEAVNEVGLTRRAEAELVYNLGQDPDQWPVILSRFVLSHGQQAEKLKTMIVNNSAEWQQLVADEKPTGFSELRQLAFDRNMQWNMRIRQFLADPFQVILLGHYLRTVINLKSKRVADVGYRAQTKQRINAILAYLASEAFVTLDKYNSATHFLATGKTSGGQDLSDFARATYLELQNENIVYLASLIAIILQIKYATCTADVQKAQDFIAKNILRPLEVKVENLEGQEKSEMRDKVKVYSRWIQAIDINF